MFTIAIQLPDKHLPRQDGLRLTPMLVTQETELHDMICGD